MIKSFLTPLIAIVIPFSVIACTEERVQKQAVEAEVVQPTQKQKEENKGAVTKRVCIDRITKDGKPVLGQDGKQLQDCREMKIHKKLEGNKVPQK
jgi:hypothetical protein